MFGRKDKEAGYLSPQFDRQNPKGKNADNGNAPITGPGKKRKIPLLKTMALLMAGTALAGLAAEGNFRYFDFKGRAPGSPQQLLDDSFHTARAAMFWAPGVQEKMDSGKKVFVNTSRAAADAMAKAHGGYIPIERFTDHVTLCIPASMTALNNPAPGTPEAFYLHDLGEFTKAVARRHAKPGVRYDENDNHNNASLPQSGAWVMYANPEKLSQYQAGQRLDRPADDQIEFNAFGHHRHCGSTDGHMDGAQNYNSYLVTNEGHFFPVTAEGRIIYEFNQQGQMVPPGTNAAATTPAQSATPAPTPPGVS